MREGEGDHVLIKSWCKRETQRGKPKEKSHGEQILLGTGTLARTFGNKVISLFLDPSTRRMWAGREPYEGHLCGRREHGGEQYQERGEKFARTWVEVLDPLVPDAGFTCQLCSYTS